MHGKLLLAREEYAYFSNTALGGQTLKQLLSVYSTTDGPDIHEGGAGLHYYQIINAPTPSKIGTYYRNGNGDFSQSLRSRIEDHYSNALNAWYNNDLNNSMKYLGYAIHYMQEILSTPHTTDLRYGGLSGPHEMFEQYARDNITKIDYQTDSALGVYGIFNDNFGEAINNFAFISSSSTFYDIVANMNAERYDEVLSVTLPITQQAIAALLDQFYKDTVGAATSPTHRSEHVIQSGKIYYIKNLMTGLYMDCWNVGTTAGTAVNAGTFLAIANQRFKAVYNGDGSFSFAPVHATNMYLTIGSILGTGENCTLQSDVSVPWQKYRITYLQDGYYRIMTGRVIMKKYYDAIRVLQQVACIKL